MGIHGLNPWGRHLVGQSFDSFMSVLIFGNTHHFVLQIRSLASGDFHEAFFPEECMTAPSMTWEKANQLCCFHFNEVGQLLEEGQTGKFLSLADQHPQVIIWLNKQILGTNMFLNLEIKIININTNFWGFLVTPESNDFLAIWSLLVLSLDISTTVLQAFEFDRQVIILVK